MKNIGNRRIYVIPAKRILSLMICCSVILSLLMGIGITEATSKAAEYALKNPQVKNGVTTWDCIYFGNYWQDDTNGDGAADQSDAKQPIKWRVLSVDGDDALILADTVLDGQKYNAVNTSTTWEKCTLRTWLNDDFFAAAFDGEEQSAVRITHNKNADNPNSGRDGGNDTDDNVFLLSIDEVCNDLYGFITDFDCDSRTRCATPSEYAIRRIVGHGANLTTFCHWWLRSAGYHNNQSMVIHPNGGGHFISHPAWECCHGVRPALHIDLSSSCWSYAGEVSSEEDNTEDSSGDNVQTGEGLSVLAETGGSIDGKAKSFFPSTWEMKNPIFPITYSKTTDSTDGSYKIKYAIGIGRTDIFDSDTTWDSYKKKCDDANKFAHYDSLLTKYKGKKVSTFDVSKFKALPKLSVMGYMEDKYDKNGVLISSSGMLAPDLKWSGSADWQFATPIGPTYISLAGSVKLGGKLGLLSDGEGIIYPSGSLSLKPEVSLEGGYGINKCATVGVGGKASLNASVKREKGKTTTTGEFEAAAYLHLYLACVIDWSYDMADYKKTLWNKQIKLKNKKVPDFELNQNKNAWRVRYIDTSFAKKTSDWNSSKTKDMKKLQKKLTADEISGNTTTLQSGVLTTTNPILCEIDGKQVMVFQDFDASRPQLNQTILKYSVCENGVWSEPKAIKDDGNADLYADMKVVNGKLVVAWQKMNRQIQGNVEEDITEVLSDLSESSEIWCAVFDTATDSFTGVTRLTEDSEADGEPRIFEGTNGPVVSWVTNSDRDLMQQTGKNSIYAKTLGGVSDTQKICETQKGICDYVLCQVEGKDKIVYLGEDDTGITGIYNSDGSIIFEPEESEDVCANLQCQDNKLYYNCAGITYEYDEETGNSREITAGTQEIPSNAILCENGGKKGWTWIINDSESHKGIVKGCIEGEEGYSDPVVLCENDESAFQVVSPLMEEDGTWRIMANMQNYSTQLNSIVYLEKESDEGITLDGVSVDERDKDEEGKTAVNYYVTNSSLDKITNLHLVFTTENGVTMEKDLDVSIEPGAVFSDKTYIDLSDIKSPATAKVQIYAEAQKNTAQNEVSVSVGQGDVKVDNSITEMEDKVLLQVVVKNISGRVTHTTLHVYSSPEKEKEIATVPSFMLAANQEITKTISIGKNLIKYNTSNAAYLTTVAEVSEGDYWEDDNVCYGILYKQDSGELNKPSSTTKPSTVKPSKTEPSTVKKAKVKKPGRVTGVSVYNKKKKKMVVSWSWKTNVAGYQIQYALNKKFTKKKKSKWAGKWKSAKTISKLKKGKKYYVRVRAYRKKSGKKLYGKWSKIKKVKIKK